MNQDKIGKFIAECRKWKTMTQCELAEKLGVTKKSINNLENGILLFKWHGYYYDVNTNVYTKS